MARDFVLSIEAGFPRHPKTRKFSRLMGTPLAPAYLVNLWAWAVEAAPSGDISSYDVSDIEDGAGYALCDGRCYQALVDAGFIDEDGAGARVLHNWMENGHTGQAIQKMETERDRWRRAKGIPTSSARNPAGVIAEATRESAGVHAPSRFTVHGSESSPPAPARDPSATTAAAITGPYLTQLFGRIRSEETGGGFEWQGTPTSPDKAATQAAIVAESGNAAHVEASMRLLFAKAKRGELDEAAKILRSPAFAFGCWCSDFVPLVEEVTGTAPEMPIAAARSARAGPRQAPHEITRAAARRFLEREAAKDTAT